MEKVTGKHIYALIYTFKHQTVHKCQILACSRLSSTYPSCDKRTLGILLRCRSIYSVIVYSSDLLYGVYIYASIFGDYTSVPLLNIMI